MVSSWVSSPSLAPSGISAAKTTIQIPSTTHLPRRLVTKLANALIGADRTAAAPATVRRPSETGGRLPVLAARRRPAARLRPSKLRQHEDAALERPGAGGRRASGRRRSPHTAGTDARARQRPPRAGSGGRGRRGSRSVQRSRCSSERNQSVRRRSARSSRRAGRRAAAAAAAARARETVDRSSYELSVSTSAGSSGRTAPARTRSGSSSSGAGSVTLAVPAKPAGAARASKRAGALAVADRAPEVDPAARAAGRALRLRRAGLEHRRGEQVGPEQELVLAPRRPLDRPG